MQCGGSEKPCPEAASVDQRLRAPKAGKGRESQRERVFFSNKERKLAAEECTAGKGKERILEGALRHTLRI